MTKSGIGAATRGSLARGAALKKWLPVESNPWSRLRGAKGFPSATSRGSPDWRSPRRSWLPPRAILSTS